MNKEFNNKPGIVPWLIYVVENLIKLGRIIRKCEKQRKKSN